MEKHDLLFVSRSMEFPDIGSSQPGTSPPATKSTFVDSAGLTERGDLPHGAAERPDVALGGVVQLRLRAERLLRRPPRRVDLLVGRREVRDAETADLDGAPVRAAEEDVSRAQLAMKYLKFGNGRCTYIVVVEPRECRIRFSSLYHNLHKSWAHPRAQPNQSYSWILCIDE